MSKVIQIRGVPDEVHDVLTSAAHAQGLSLTTYMQHELEHMAERVQAVTHNAAVARDTQSRVRGGISRESILAALHEGRGE